MIYKYTKDLKSKFNNDTTSIELWAFRFERCSGKSGRVHNKVPMLGELYGEIVCGNLKLKKFIPYKVVRGEITDELDISKKLSVLGLTFADTYDEAMEAYSEKVEAEIEFHKQKIAALEKFIIPRKHKGEKV